jgi:hypothetical protein
MELYCHFAIRLHGVVFNHMEEVIITLQRKTLSPSKCIFRSDDVRMEGLRKTTTNLRGGSNSIET